MGRRSKGIYVSFLLGYGRILEDTPTCGFWNFRDAALPTFIFSLIASSGEGSYLEACAFALALIGIELLIVGILAIFKLVREWKESGK